MSKIKKVSMRIPVDLHGRLVKEAENHNRSLHAEIIDILEANFDPYRLRFRAGDLERGAVTHTDGGES